MSPPTSSSTNWRSLKTAHLIPMSLYRARNRGWAVQHDEEESKAEGQQQKPPVSAPETTRNLAESEHPVGSSAIPESRDPQASAQSSSSDPTSSDYSDGAFDSDPDTPGSCGYHTSMHAWVKKTEEMEAALREKDMLLAYKDKLLVRKDNLLARKHLEVSRAAVQIRGKEVQIQWFERKVAELQVKYAVFEARVEEERKAEREREKQMAKERMEVMKEQAYREERVEQEQKAEKERKQMEKEKERRERAKLKRYFRFGGARLGTLEEETKEEKLSLMEALMQD